VSNNVPIIAEIGIEICLNCPYFDCLSTDTELCQPIKDEVERVKAEAQAEQDKADQEMITNILSAIKKDGPLSMPQLRDRFDYRYDEIDRLVRIKKLKVKKEKIGRRTQIFIID
jgi:hypothetical protein